MNDWSWMSFIAGAMVGVIACGLAEVAERFLREDGDKP